jgi:triacylglycerol lipase
MNEKKAMSEEIPRRLDDRARTDILLKEYGTLRSEITSRINARFAIVGFLVALAIFVIIQSNISLGWREFVATLALFVNIVAWFRLGQLITRCSARLVAIEHKINETCDEDIFVCESQVASRRLFLWFWMIFIGAVLVGAMFGAGYCVYVALSPPCREDSIDEARHPEPSPVVPASPMEKFRLAWDSEAYADWPVAELLASMSNQAYLTPVEAEASYHTLGFEKITPVVEGSMIGYVASGKDVTVIAFRGTNAREISDWIANLDCLSTDTQYGAIHKGFYNAYQSLKPQIVTLIGESKPKHLWITGHSLGGALALACAYDLIENEKVHLDGIITFGQPIVAHKQLAEHLDAVLLGRYAYFVNEADIVPRVPPNYTYCGSLVWFTGNGIKRSKPKHQVLGAIGAGNTSSKDVEEIIPLSKDEFQKLQTELRNTDTEPDRLPDGRLILKGNLPWIRDHSMELYLERIRNIIRSSKSN